MITGGGREFLFDLNSDKEGKYNLSAKHAELTMRLRSKLDTLTQQLNPGGHPI